MILSAGNSRKRKGEITYSYFHPCSTYVQHRYVAHSTLCYVTELNQEQGCCWFFSGKEYFKYYAALKQLVAQVTTQWCLSICKKSHRSTVADSFPVLYRDMCVTSLINGTGGEKEHLGEIEEVTAVTLICQAESSDEHNCCNCFKIS